MRFFFISNFNFFARFFYFFKLTPLVMMSKYLIRAHGADNTLTQFVAFTIATCVHDSEYEN